MANIQDWHKKRLAENPEYAKAVAELAAESPLWDTCPMCGPMVRCGHCDNNCCNGGSGENCPEKCASAYAIQEAGWKLIGKTLVDE